MSEPTLTLEDILARHDAGAADQLGIPLDDATLTSNAEPSKLDRRSFVQLCLSAGLLVTVSWNAGAEEDDPPPRRGRGGGGGGARATNVSQRLHIGKDGVISVFTGKVECGQGARAELTQAAAEELRVPATSIQLVMADTGDVPDDGGTSGSRSTPGTVPEIRRGAAGARELIVGIACKKWNVEANTVEARDGKIIHAASKREISYADIANEDPKNLQQAIPGNVALTAVKDWKVLGTSVPRPNARSIVTGAHGYPSDIRRTGMMYGKVLRAPTYGANLKSVDAAALKDMKDVTLVHEGYFAGVVAPTSFAAQAAIVALAKTAVWEGGNTSVSSKTLYEHLKQKANVPKNPYADEVAKAAKSLKQSYRIPYAQHAPMEPRAAVAEWDGDKLTVWTGTQNPFGSRTALASALNIKAENVRVIVPDFGGGFGGKHSPDAGIEAARLARAAKKPVSLRWTREEEFTWAYFRPAGVVEAEATFDANGKLSSWHFVNINSGASGVQSPYSVPKNKSEFVRSNSVLREGSYRALASTFNVFARECFMDELAQLAGKDPLDFRLAHLPDGRLKAVLEAVAKKFDWKNRITKKEPNVGIGLACGTEKASYTATCVELEIKDNEIVLKHIWQAYECGAILNPENLKSQVVGAIIMGLGPALREEMVFENGKMSNATFKEYLVPRFRDVPPIEVELLNRTDLASVGAGETPIVGIAPAIANAVFNATGKRVREMPIKLN